MSLNIIRGLLNALEIAILLHSIINTIRLIRREKLSVPVIFFAMGAMALVVSLVYWLAYDLIMPPDIRMPFAANELGESAGFLLIASSLKAAFGEKMNLRTKETALGLAFTAVNIFLWIGWSGEIIQDLVGGAAFGYLVCIMLNSLRRSSVFSRRTGIAAVVLFTLITALALPSIYFPEPMRAAADAYPYPLIILSSIYFTWRAAKSMRGASAGKEAYAAAAFCYVWCTAGMYMCSEPVYYIPNILAIISVQIMMLSLRKAVNEL